MPTELAPGAGLQALRRLAAADQPIGPPRYVLFPSVLGEPADQFIDAMVAGKVPGPPVRTKLLSTKS